MKARLWPIPTCASPGDEPPGQPPAAAGAAALGQPPGDGLAWYLLIGSMAVLGGGQGRRQPPLGLMVPGGRRPVPRTEGQHPPAPAVSPPPPVVARVRPLDEFSFPSGHVLHAASQSLVALHYAPVLAWVPLPLASLIALSRVALACTILRRAGGCGHCRRRHRRWPGGLNRHLAFCYLYGSIPYMPANDANRGPRKLPMPASTCAWHA